MNNYTMLVGHVGAPPELRSFDSGTRLATFSLAVKMIGGAEKDRTVWFKIKAWGSAADRVEKCVTRGREVVVTGQLDIETYTDRAGTRQDRPVIRLNSFHLCGRKPESDAAGDTAEPATLVAKVSTRTRRKHSVA